MRCAERDGAATLTFLAREQIDTLRVTAASGVNQGGLPVTFVSKPFASKLSIVTAYIAFAFVGAIVLGVIY